MDHIRCTPRYPASSLMEEAAKCDNAAEPWNARDDAGYGEPREGEITDAECEDFARQAWKLANQNTDAPTFTYWHHRKVHVYEIAIARHALKQLAAAKGTK